MRLGAPVFTSAADPTAWAAAHRERGYGAAFWPLKPGADEADEQAVVRAAEAADLAIAEVGAWSNPVSPIDDVRLRSIAHCQDRLATADRVGARCCVTVSGSRGKQDPASLTGPGWAGPHPDNLTDHTFDLIVDTVREIIDAVKPARAAFALETMPWMYPDSPQTYLRLINAIDRPEFAVHLDPVNLVSSPQRYFNNAALIRDCFETLGARVRSCHAKDIALGTGLTVHLDEVRPGTGALDYRTFLRAVETVGPDTPLMTEHLTSEADYTAAADHIRTVAADLDIALRPG